MGTQIDNERILIFGDAHGEERQSYVFRPEEGTVKGVCNLVEPSGFVNPGMKFKNQYYVIGKDNVVHYCQLGKDAQVNWNIVQ